MTRVLDVETPRNWLGGTFYDGYLRFMEIFDFFTNLDATNAFWSRTASSLKLLWYQNLFVFNRI